MIAPPPAVVCVGHALKETLGAVDAGRALAEGVRQAGATVARVLALSDGGDGFLDAMAEAWPGAQRRTAPARDALGRPIEAEWLFDPATRHAAIESARACGLALIAPAERDVAASGTSGVADLLLAARDAGAQVAHVGLGGSATTDGGLGLIASLVCEGCALTAEDLIDGHHAPIVDARRSLGGMALVAYSDVTNPLLGPHGCARVFGPQKGASPELVAALDAALDGYADTVERALGEPGLRDRPGAGAAGGLGFALMALGARLRPGAEALLDALAFDDSLRAADIVVTCEGRFDATSLRGKAPWVVAMRARQDGCRALLLGGTVDPAAAIQARAAGIEIVEFAPNLPRERRAADSPRLMAEALARVLSSTISPTEPPPHG